MLSRLLTTKEQFVLVGVAAAICVGSIAVFLTRTPGTAGPDSAKSPPREIIIREVVRADPPPGSAREREEPEPAPVIVRVDPPKPVAVSIAGAVVSPGLYTLDGGSRVADLIRAAGGLLEYADPSDINMAASLIDGTTLTVPRGAHAAVEGNRLVVRGAPRLAAGNPPQYTLSGWSQGETKPIAQGPVATAETAPSAVQPGLVDLNRATADQLETLPGIGPKRAQDIIDYRQQHPFTSVDDLDNVRGVGPKTMETLRPLVTVGPS